MRSALPIIWTIAAISAGYVGASITRPRVEFPPPISFHRGNLGPVLVVDNRPATAVEINAVTAALNRRYIKAMVWKEAREKKQPRLRKAAAPLLFDGEAR